MSIYSEITNLAREIDGLRYTVPKSRNRHREIDSTLSVLSQKINGCATKVKELQESTDTNMALFESLIDLFERKHIIIAQETPKDIADFASDLFGSMRGMIADYERLKGESSSDSDSL